MIKALQIQNFQSHQDSTLEFSPGVNIIIGKSDSGKSAILRALNWVINNRPGGNEFQSHWGGDISVGIELGNSINVLRNKGSENSYYLSTDEDEKVFKAFGMDVPEEIREILQIGQINFQSQFDKPFLLTDSSGEVARHFNSIAHLDLITISQKKIDSKILKIKTDKEYDESKLESVREKIKNLANLEKIEIRVEVLEDLEKRHFQAILAAKKLKGIITQLSVIKVEKRLKTAITGLDPQVVKLCEIKTGISDLQTRIETLSGYIERLNRFKTSKGKLEQKIQLENKVDDLQEQETLFATKDDQIARLESILKRFSIVNRKKSEAKKELEALETRYNVNFPDVCPLCDTVLK